MTEEKRFRIGVEFQPMTIPKPTGLTVLIDGKSAAWFTLEEVEEAVARYKEMAAIYEHSRE